MVFTLFKMGFFGAAHGWGVQQGPTPLPIKSYKNETWHSYTVPKEDPKKDMNHVTHHLSSADISTFSPAIGKFCFIKRYRYRFHFDA